MILISLVFAGFFNEHSRGWHWYDDPVVEEEPKEKTPEKTPENKSQTAVVIIENIKKDLQEKLSEALLNPSAENIKAYIILQEKLSKQSELFAETWKKTIYQNPELDFSLKKPVNQMARHVYLDQEKIMKKQLIRSLSKEYGLFFFASSNCAYCHTFAPIVKAFANEYGWSVLAISADGSPVPEFEDYETNNGAFPLKALPALLAIHPQTGEVIPIAYGLTSIEEMENRIVTLIGGHQ